MGRRPHRRKPEPLAVTLPKQAFDYLVYLAEQGRLGPSENDVAAHILVREIDKMLVSKYHEITAPVSLGESDDEAD